MLQYLLYDEQSFDDDTPDPPVTPPAISATATSADDAPVFALLCSQFGIVLADWSHAPATTLRGRHLACVLDGTTTVAVPLEVTDPSVTLLARTLAALRAWEPSA